MAEPKGQNRWKIMVAVVLFGLLHIVSSQVIANDEPTSQTETKATVAEDQHCEQVITLLQEQKRSTSREFRQLKREVAALSQKIEKPGISEILGGIGYILGIFGVAAYVMSRKKDVSGRQ